MMIQIHHNNVDIPIESLSNGEKTRLSLLILISMLDAMKSVTDAETNYLVIDEAVSSLDASGAAEMEKLFSYLKSLGQSVFIITHGKELDQVHYTNSLTVTKENGVSGILVEEL
jgi:energy-coupling factor transporter ATP-binding protein EcfA2